MAHELVTEVLRDAPGELGSGEMVVLIVIAEAAGVKPGRTRSGQVLRPRESVLRQDTMLERTRIAKRTLQDVFERLAGRGLEVRVPVGETKSGKPVYAYHGRATTFRLPIFPKGADSADWSADFANRSAESAPRTVGEPLGEPPEEPSDPWRDRGQRGASAASIPADERSETDLEDLVDEVEHRVSGFDGAEESTARGMLTTGSAVPAVVNTIGSQRARSTA